MVRMTNTYLLDGTDDPDDIIASTEHGVYVAQLGGGQVNTATGDFVFGMTEAYLIEDGEITEPIREGNLIGNGPEVLRNIDAIGNDFAMGSPGMCGKDGQGVPVGDGVPTLRVTALTVGGTAACLMADLLDIADRVVGWAGDGEQVEAFVVRSRDTEVRAYEGEVETSRRRRPHGVGVRVIIERPSGLRVLRHARRRRAAGGARPRPATTPSSPRPTSTRRRRARRRAVRVARPLA